jgi:hypothetical protein
VSVGDRFPDQLGDIDDEIGFGLAWVARRSDLADTDADDVVQPPIWLAIGQVEQRPTTWRRPGGVGAAIPMPLTMAAAGTVSEG